MISRARKIRNRTKKYGILNKIQNRGNTLTLCHARSNAIATGALFNDNFNTRNPSPKIIKYSENSDNFESTYGLYLFLQQIILITKSELKNPVLRKCTIIWCKATLFTHKSTIILLSFINFIFRYQLNSFVWKIDAFCWNYCFGLSFAILSYFTSKESLIFPSVFDRPIIGGIWYDEWHKKEQSLVNLRL